MGILRRSGAGVINTIFMSVFSSGARRAPFRRLKPPPGFAIIKKKKRAAGPGESNMELTRNALIDSFCQLLEEKPLNRITVKEVASRCGVNRNTFYYHFQGIPDLLSTMLAEKADGLIREHYRPGSPIDCIRPLARFGLCHRQAVLHVYRAVPREEFLLHLEKVSQNLVREYFDNLPPEAFAAPADREILIRYYKCALIGVIIDWLDAGMDYDLPAAAERLCVLLKDREAPAVHAVPQRPVKRG